MPPNALSVGNRAARVTLSGSSSAFLTYALTRGSLKLALGAPRFELNGETSVLTLTRVAPCAKPRRLSNGATEYVLGGPVKGRPGLTLEVVIRVPARNPVIRFHYRLRSASTHRLTKQNGADAITYFHATLKGAELREVQLSAFEKVFNFVSEILRFQQIKFGNSFCAVFKFNLFLEFVNFSERFLERGIFHP